MHVLDQVEGIDIESGKPAHHTVKFVHHFIIVQIFGSNGTAFRPYLFLCLFIYSAVNSVKKTFCKVCPRTEKLHFLSGLGCGDTAADGIIISPYRAHNVVIFILDGTGLNGNIGCIVFKLFRKPGGIKHSQIRLRGRPHIFQSVKESVVGPCYHGTTVLSHAGHFQSRPYRIAGEELIVGGDPGKFNHAEFHG